MLNQTSGNDDAKLFVDTLIAGLGSSRRQLSDKCSRALRALGGRVRQLLADVADEQSTQAAHRRRLHATIGLIGDSQPMDEQAGVLIMQALLEIYRVDDRQLHEMATAA